MSKMTAEQFLSHLGIEVGKPFIYKVYGKDVKLVVKQYEDSECYVGRVSDGKLFSNIGYLLDCEITLLPKYTLTEDEKDFVKIATISVFSRNNLGELFYTDHHDNQSLLPIDHHLFPFVKHGVRVYLDELRKCL